MYEPLFSDFMLWERGDATYGALCTHTSLKEGIVGDFNLTGPQLLAVAAHRKLQLRHRKKMNKRAQRANEPDRVRNMHKKVIARILAEKRHWCDVCKQALRSSATLKKHPASKAHAREVAIAAAGKRPVKSAEAQRVAECYTKVLVAKKHYCAVCDYNAPCKANLDKHLATKKHQKPLLLSPPKQLQRPQLDLS